MHSDSDNTVNIEAELLLAKELIKGQILDEALSYLKKILEKTDQPEVHYLIGKVLYLKGKFQESVSHLTTVIAQDPNHWQAYELLGELYRTLEDYGTAEEFYQKATNINQQAKLAWKGLGKIALAREELQTTVLAFETYLKLAEEDKDVWVLLGDCYDKLGNYSSAVDAYNVAIDLDPTDISLYEKLGDVYAKMGYLDIAKKQYQRALMVKEKTRETELSIYHKLIKIHLQEKEYAKAYNLCMSLESTMLNPDPDTLFYAGQALVGIGNIYEGIEKIKQALKKEKRKEFEQYLNSLEDELLKKRGLR